MKNAEKVGGVLLVAGSAASFGLTPIFAKIAYSAGINIYSLLFLRFLVAAVFMFSLLFVKKLTLPSKKEMLALFLLGAAGYASQSFCYFMALNYASSSVVSLLFYTSPIMVMIGSAIFLKEKITIQKVVALCFALVGACVIIGEKLHVNSMGLVFTVLSALFYTAYVLVSSKVVKAGMGIQSSAFIMLGAMVVFGVINLFTGFNPPNNFKGIIAVVMTAVVSTVFAFWSFFTGMKITGPSIASLVSAVEPVVTVFSSVIFLSEKITIKIIIGGCLVLGSLIVTLIPSKKRDLNVR